MNVPRHCVGISPRGVNRKPPDSRRNHGDDNSQIFPFRVDLSLD